MLLNIDPECIAHLNGTSNALKDLCTLECTVVTGLEEASADECRDALGVKPVTARGRVIFDINIDRVPDVLKLRSIDNVNLILHFVKDFGFPNDREKCFGILFKLAEVPDWRKGLTILKILHNEVYEDAFENEAPLTDEYCTPRPDIDLKWMKDSTCDRLKNIPKHLVPDIDQSKEHNENKLENESGNNTDAKAQNPDNQASKNKCTGPKFRVTCSRSGDNHSFGSAEAARQFGGGINERLGWPVNLNNYDIEVILNIINNFGYISIALTKQVLFKRNLIAFGRTNLRSTICYNMIRLAKPQIGDIIVDPMCGGGSIPIEGFQTYPNALHIGGDNFKPAVERCDANLKYVLEQQKKSAPVDFCYWDCTNLPLRDQSVDVVISDLPFGKRLGNTMDNRVLYLHSLVELSRVVKTETGRAVMLTYDRNSMINSLKVVNKLWKNSATRTINVGGLFAGVFTLIRSNILVDKDLKLNPIQRKGKKRDHKQVNSSESDT